MKKRSGRPRRNDSIVNVVREWVSDNLRYLIIAAAAVIVLLIIIFAVKGSNNKETADTANENASKTASVATGTPVPDQWKNSTATTITVTPSAQTPSESTNTAMQGYPSLDVPGTVITYLDAVAYGDVDTATAYSEDIDEGTIATIENGHPFSEFSNIYVYEYPGAKSGEYVAVTTFDYTERATGNTYPGIGAYYLVTGTDGIIRMASGKTTADNQAAIDEVVNLPEIQQVIANVNEAYNATVAAMNGGAENAEGEPQEGQTEGAAEEIPAEAAQEAAPEEVPAEEGAADGAAEEGAGEAAAEESGDVF